MQVAKFEFVLRTANSFGLPEYKGSTFRGKFGHVLKRTICLMPDRNCETCQIRQKCAYPYLFETRNDRNENVPRPFIIEPPLTRKRFFLKDEKLYLNILLMGRAIDYLTYFVYVVEKMGREGIGQDRGRYRVESVNAIDGAGKRVPIYSPENATLSQKFTRIDLNDFKATLQPQVTIEFMTPTQLQRKGKIAPRPDFESLLKAVIRRFQSLQYFHGDGNKERFAIDWQQAGQIEMLKSEGRLRELKRYSNRQGRPVYHHGYVGRVTYRGNLSQFIPWLQIGEYLHVGKGAVFGLGQYRIVG